MVEQKDQMRSKGICSLVYLETQKPRNLVAKTPRKTNLLELEAQVRNAPGGPEVDQIGRMSNGKPILAAAACKPRTK